MKVQASLRFVVLLTLLVVSCGCEGPSGPRSGKDAASLSQPAPVHCENLEVDTHQGAKGPLERAGDKNALYLSILFFNDIHGHLLPFNVKVGGQTEEVGGVSRLAALIKRIRSDNEAKGVKTIVLIAGDILQGTPMSTVFHGRPDVECFNAIGVDAMTVGNHEFDFGLATFLALRKLASFPFISSNIALKDSEALLCEPSVTIGLSNTVSLTVIGVTTKELLTTTKPSNVERLSVLDSVKAVREVFTRVKDKGPVVLLSHSKHETDREIAIAVPEITAIIGGHDQILLEPYQRIGGVPVFEAFEKGKYLGRLECAIDPATRKARVLCWSYIPINAEIQPDPETEQIVQTYYSLLDKRFKEVIGRSRTFLDGERERIRYEETNLGNFVTDVMREYTGCQMAIINAGSLRASIDAGPITVESVFKMMPYDNDLIKIQVKGSELLLALTRAIQGRREDEDGGFLHVSGIRFTIRGRRIARTWVLSDNGPLNLEKTYSVAITDFLAAGGDGYTVFLGKPAVRTGLPLRDLIVDTIMEKREVDAQVEGRIVRSAE